MGTADDIRQALREEADRLLEEFGRGPRPLLSLRGVARRLGVSERTVESIIADGDIHPIRIRGQRRFDPDAVEAFISRCAS